MPKSFKFSDTPSHLVIDMGNDLLVLSHADNSYVVLPNPNSARNTGEVPAFVRAGETTGELIERVKKLIPEKK